MLYYDLEYIATFKAAIPLVMYYTKLYIDLLMAPQVIQHNQFHLQHFSWVFHTHNAFMFGIVNLTPTLRLGTGHT